ncbi:MAG TPA: TIGR03435 family protein [Candidatus Sulfopaludibacter sp.]|jgi:uncharacterized protein (TIGR03435 family)|nr:TIGR03435 family protein [Candidatus Sulfopaludibacter sp.]
MRLVTPCLLAAVLCFAQEKPAFDVASVKPNTGGPESGFSLDIAPSGRVTFRNLDLWNLIKTAYGLRDLQMSGGPSWIKDRRYDIVAQPAPGAAAAPREQAMRMLQTLLEDRFQLKWHHETREGSAYGLTVGRGGPKLPPAHEGRGRTKFGDLDDPNMTLDQLCQILEFDLLRPVINRTNLSAPFTVQLRWASERNLSASQADPALPSLFTAVQEQLGLKLEAIKAPVQIFVIDSVEAPTGN